MLRKFKISIDGKEYVVEMEEIGGVAQPVTAPVQAAVAPVVEVAAAPVPTQAAGSTEGETIDSPMPGTILRVDVQVGDVVTLEQPLVVLEAMKMENEIVAPKAGTITGVHVTAGQAIDVGAPMITIA